MVFCGKHKAKSPGTASLRVGLTKPSLMRLTVLRLPCLMSPKRWTKTEPHANWLAKDETFNAYSFGFLNGSSKWCVTNKAKLVFSLDKDGSL